MCPLESEGDPNGSRGYRGTEGRGCATGIWGGLDSFFKLTERGTTVGTEMKAGLATFMVMSYILFLNPIILSNVRRR